MTRRSNMERTRGETDMSARNGNIESHMHLGMNPGGDDTASGVGRRLRDARDRAGWIAENARLRVGGTLARTADAFSGRGDVLAALRARPMAALGAAFTTGFLLAAVTGGRNRHWALDSVRRQLKTIVVGATTAAIAQELRAMVDDAKLEELREDCAPEDLEDDQLHLDYEDDREAPGEFPF
jgi:hypothetical protein